MKKHRLESSFQAVKIVVYYNRQIPEKTAATDFRIFLCVLKHLKEKGKFTLYSQPGLLFSGCFFLYFLILIYFSSKLIGTAALLCATALLIVI